MQMVGEKDADLDVAIAREDRFIRGAVMRREIAAENGRGTRHRGRAVGIGRDNLLDHPRLARALSRKHENEGPRGREAVRARRGCGLHHSPSASRCS